MAGAPHTAKEKITWINLCVSGVPLPPYIKEPRGGAAGQEEGAPGGVLLPPGVGFPPFLVGIGFGRGKEEREKEGGRRPPSPWPIRTRAEGRAAQPWPPLLSSTKAH